MGVGHQEGAGAGASTNPNLTRAAEVVGEGIVVGVGVYAAYRIVRMLPSLFPPLWWTIPANAAIP